MLTLFALTFVTAEPVQYLSIQSTPQQVAAILRIEGVTIVSYNQHSLVVTATRPAVQSLASYRPLSMMPPLRTITLEAQPADSATKAVRDVELGLPGDSGHPIPPNRSNAASKQPEVRLSPVEKVVPNPPGVSIDELKRRSAEARRRALRERGSE